MGTSNDVLMFAASGTGAMDCHCFEPLLRRATRSSSASAGKFGERWAEIAKAYGLDAIVMTVPIRRQSSTPSRSKQALEAEPAV